MNSHVLITTGTFVIPRVHGHEKLKLLKLMEKHDNTPHAPTPWFRELNALKNIYIYIFYWVWELFRGLRGSKKINSCSITRKHPSKTLEILPLHSLLWYESNIINAGHQSHRQHTWGTLRHCPPMQLTCRAAILGQQPFQSPLLSEMFPASSCGTSHLPLSSASILMHWCALLSAVQCGSLHPGSSWVPHQMKSPITCCSHQACILYSNWMLYLFPWLVASDHVAIIYLNLFQGKDLIKKYK